MGGVTVHSGGDVGVGEYDKKLEHTDIDLLFTRNQDLRWIICDEVGMVGEDLLHAFEKHITDAAKISTYKQRADKSLRPFGGYNLLTFGDLFQIPPIPASTSLCIPPENSMILEQSSSLALFWSVDPKDSINFFIELAEQKRVVNDPWYSCLLNECRFGCLSTTMYRYLLGCPTQYAGSWMPTNDKTTCGNQECNNLHHTWDYLKDEQNATWQTMQAMECDYCASERERRNRLILPSDPRVNEEPFLSAPYMHKNNEPKYHAMLLRSAENAKKNRQYILWFCAQDTPDNPAQIAKNPHELKARLEKLLWLHDQKTANIPGLTPLYLGLKGRVTDKICMTNNITILKHQPVTLVGWELHPADRLKRHGCEGYLNYLPLRLHLRVEGATWIIHKKLSPGVFPLFPKNKTWILNKTSGATIKRRGFTFLPDYASTAFMIQGATLVAGLADCGDVMDRVGNSEAMTAYVILSRLTSATGLLLLRAFSPYLFSMGSANGPSCLLEHLRERFSQEKPTVSVENSRAKYDRRKREEEIQKQKRKQNGPVFQCRKCKSTLPAEGFGANREKSDQVYALCMEPGYWIDCLICEEALIQYRAHSPRIKDEKICESCETARLVFWFDDGASSCKICDRNASFTQVLCEQCESYRPLTECFQVTADPQTYCCYQCNPNECIIKCTVCETAHPASNFRGDVRVVRKQTIRRCFHCEKCKYCQQIFSDYRKFTCNTNACTACDAEHKKRCCDVCKQWLELPKFSASQLMAKSRNSTLRCINCHECDRCHLSLQGNAFAGNATTCKSCIEANKEWLCAACQKKKSS